MVLQFDSESLATVNYVGEEKAIAKKSTITTDELVLELTQRHFPRRLKELPPAIFLEHYVAEHAAQGRLGRMATWDRLSFTPGRRGEPLSEKVCALLA